MSSRVQEDAVASLSAILVQARAADERGRRKLVNSVGSNAFTAPLTDSFGELAAFVTATAVGIQILRGNTVATEIPPPLPWPLDELIDDSDLGDWSVEGLVVDLSEVNTHAPFYYREYGLDLSELFGEYRRTWNTWRRFQRRVQESAELYDVLDELETAISLSARTVDTVIAAWRLVVPEHGIDTRIAFRSARLVRIIAKAAEGDLGDDETASSTDVRGIALTIDPAEPMFIELGSTGLTADGGESLQFRTSVLERNDLPVGAHVRSRVFDDVRPAVARALHRQWGSDVAWTLTMSPALLVRESSAEQDQSEIQRLKDAVTTILAPWPDLAEQTQAEISDVTRGRWGSLVEKRLAELIARLELPAATGTEPIDVAADSIVVTISDTPKFRDRLRARANPVDILTRFRDRRRAAAAASVVAPAFSIDASESPSQSLEIDSGSTVTGLDELQRGVAEAATEDRLVVVAGAGQGKTEVVAARLDHLARECDLSLSTEVLVLSFSRAAVSAVRSRLETRVLAQAEIRTFDSFANRVIIDAGEDPKGNFDTRIERAVGLLADEDADLPMLEDIQHVVLDEVQDLVGQRAKLVLALIDRLGDEVGFTALGDPNQALYDFQLSPEEQTQRLDVISELRGLANVESTGLQRNFRARGKDPLAVVELGSRLREMDSGARAREEVDAFISRLESVDSSAWLTDVYRAGRSTAILTKTNGDALRVSQQLTALNIRHTLRRTAQEHGARAWVAELAQQLPRNMNRREDVIAALQNTSVIDPIDAWNLLKESEGRTQFPNNLDLSRIRRVIGGYGIPTALLADATEDVVVSTVHRAKGLEFERVFLFDTDYEPDDDDFAIARRNYVALSRARDEIVRCAPKATKSWMKKDTASVGRWTEQVFGKGGKRTRAIEIRFNDMNTDEPFECGENAPAVQSLLAAGTLVGQTVTLVLDLEWTHRDAPIYLVKDSDGVAFARTSEQFGRDIRRIFMIGNARWPTILNGATTMSIESVAGSPEVSDELGIGDSGIWLVPRLAGLVQPDWKTRWDGKN